jgi:hypothetical protein
METMPPPQTASSERSEDAPDFSDGNVPAGYFRAFRHEYPDSPLPSLSEMSAFARALIAARLHRHQERFGPDCECNGEVAARRAEFRRKAEAVYPPGRHRHQCPQCHTVWEHDNESAVRDAHRCPSSECGFFEKPTSYRKYVGDDPPVYHDPGSRLARQVDLAFVPDGTNWYGDL